MAGTFRSVWPRFANEVLVEIAKHEDAHSVIWTDFLREIANAWRPTVEYTRDDQERVVPVIDHHGNLEEALQDEERARHFVHAMQPDQFGSEGLLVDGLESLFKALEIETTPILANLYRELVAQFVADHNLRYEVLDDCSICPNAAGIIQGLVVDIRRIAQRDGHLAGLLSDFDETVRDIRRERSSNKFRTAIQRNVNLLEAVGERHLVALVATPEGAGARNWRGRPDNLGKISRGIQTLPHESLRIALDALYTFTCDYPGIRHGGNPESKVREIQLRDLAAMLAIFVGIVPYVTDDLDWKEVYGWGEEE